VHGEPAAMSTFAKLLSRTRVLMPQPHQSFEL
jgi:hypothetical protein